MDQQVNDFQKLPPMERLIKVMAALRHPDTGCAWDLEQTFATIAPYTIEEAYEVDDAIAEGDMAHLKEELGDLLLQVAFHARMAEEEGHFAFDDVAGAIANKMIKRHPHVFGDASVRNSTEQTVAWEDQKAEERAEKAAHDAKPTSVLDGVAGNLPALLRSIKLQKRAARTGFDWPDILPVLDKIEEELGELKQEISDAGSKARLAEEYGDLMFVFANLARHLNLDPEQSLRDANRKFIRRFSEVERLAIAETGEIEGHDLDYLDSLWDRVKAAERK
jgi:tetrapyrrole methylase family protein/MazG family protein/ATP diphosphatase